jgi:EAL and modified HD-GYP domain-containing signal transduction protein
VNDVTETCEKIDRHASDTEVALVGRQPICAADGTLKAYKLLFRSSEDSCGVIDAHLATSTVLLNTFVEIGLDRVVGSKQAFVRLTRDFLVGEQPLPSRPDLLVIELIENIEVDDELVAGVQKLKRKGFTITLDDVVARPELERLFPLADIVKLDLRTVSLDQMKERCRQLRRRSVRLLAEKIETVEEFDACRKQNFELYQGYYISRPHSLHRVKSKTNKAIVLQLLAQMCAPQFSFAKLAEIVKLDAGLSCRFLRYVNSAFHGLQSIRSIDHALIMMGAKGIRGLTALLQMTGMSDMPEQCVASAVVRGQMCRLLAERMLPGEAESLSTLGILSTLDVLLTEPMEVLLDDLPITPQMRAAILTHAGVSGQILKAVVAYDMGDWPNARLEGVAQATLRDAYLAALARADEVVSALTSKNRERLSAADIGH